MPILDFLVRSYYETKEIINDPCVKSKFPSMIHA